MSAFGDFLNDISYGKKYLLNESNEGEYIPFVINNMFSRYSDSIFHANEMNMLPNIPKKAHYTYMMNSLRARKRYSKMKKVKRHPHFETIQEYYNYSDEKTEHAMRLLAEEQIDYIINVRGGVR